MTTTATEETRTEDLAIEQQDASPAEQASAAGEQPVHLAICAECHKRLGFQRTRAGGGFRIADFGDFSNDTLFGIGPNGIPICPNGHGELTIADDQLPAADAFALAQEQLAAAQPAERRLPFPTPPFNYEASLHSIFEYRREVARLEVRLADADDRRKKAKSALDTANEELGELIDKFEQAEKDRLAELERKEAQIEAGHPDGANLVRCKWEEQHPGEVCPICSDSAAVLDATRDSEGHVEDVAALLDCRSAVAVGDALEAFGILVPVLTIQRWSEDERAAVTAYAESAGTAERPKVLGTCHVAGEGRNGEPQTCTQCDAVLIAATEDGSDPNYFAEGILVATDCPGKAAADGHHYPEKKKRGRRKAETTEAAE